MLSKRAVLSQFRPLPTSLGLQYVRRSFKASSGTFLCYHLPINGLQKAINCDPCIEDCAVLACIVQTFGYDPNNCKDNCSRLSIIDVACDRDI